MKFFEDLLTGVVSRIDRSAVIAKYLSDITFKVVANWLPSFSRIDIDNSNYYDYETDEESEEEWIPTQRVHLSDQFNLPQHISDGKNNYESKDQFITVETEDGIKMLHIYHLKNKCRDRQKKTIWRLFCDYQTGWLYVYRSGRPYARYRRIFEPNV